MNPSALILTRVSTSGQLAGVSLEEQLAACRTWCDAHGYDAIELPPSIPRDISGSMPWKKRIDLHAALDTYKDGRVGKIVVYAQNRLERNSEVLREFVKAVLGVRGQFDVISALTGQPIKLGLMNRIESEFNQEWRDQIFETTYRKRYFAVASGEPVMGGDLPLGLRRRYEFDSRKGKRRVAAIEIDPKPARLVRSIFQWYREGQGVHAICNRLNDKGVPTPWVMKEKTPRKRPNSGRWGPATIRVLLKNEAYVGRLGMCKGKPAPRVVEREIVREAIVFPVPPIIDDDLWAAVQRGLEMKRARALETGANRKLPMWPLQALVKCECGQLYQKRPTRSGTRVLECPAKRLHTPCENTKYARLHCDRLEPLVVAALRDLFADPTAAVRQRLDNLDARIEEMEQALRPYKADVQQIELATQRLRQLVKSGRLTQEQFDADMKELGAKVAGLERKTSGKRSELDHLKRLKADRERLQKDLDADRLSVLVGRTGEAILRHVTDTELLVVKTRELREVLLAMGVRFVIDRHGRLTMNGDLVGVLGADDMEVEQMATKRTGGLKTSVRSASTRRATSVSRSGERRSRSTSPARRPASRTCTCTGRKSTWSTAAVPPCRSRTRTSSPWAPSPTPRTTARP